MTMICTVCGAETDNIFACDWCDSTAIRDMTRFIVLGRLHTPDAITVQEDLKELISHWFEPGFSQAHAEEMVKLIQLF